MKISYFFSSSSVYCSLNCRYYQTIVDLIIQISLPARELNLVWFQAGKKSKKEKKNIQHVWDRRKSSSGQFFYLSNITRKLPFTLTSCDSSCHHHHHAWFQKVGQSCSHGGASFLLQLPVKSSASLRSVFLLSVSEAVLHRSLRNLLTFSRYTC